MSFRPTLVCVALAISTASLAGIGCASRPARPPGPPPEYEEPPTVAAPPAGDASAPPAPSADASAAPPA